MDIRALACDAVRDAIALVLPVACAGCGAPDRSVCNACALSLDVDIGVTELDDSFAVFHALDFSGRARDIVVALKDKQRTDVARILAPPLYRAVIYSLAGIDLSDVLLVPIPSSNRSDRMRGYVPSKVVMRRAQLRPSSILRLCREPADQRTLSRSSRAINMSGSMKAEDSMRRGRPVVIIDDVLTTGTTIREARRALRVAGAHVLGAAVIAKTPLASDA